MPPRHQARRLLLALGAAALALPLAAGADAGPAPAVVVFGGDRDYPPYEFLDADGHPAGYNVDLTRAIADVMGMTIDFRFGGWAEMRAGLMSGEIDVLQGITFSEARARMLDFAPPHAIVHHALFAREETPAIGSLDELGGKSVIVFRGGIMDEMVTRRGTASRIVRTGTPADALRLLSSGQHDYVALALLPGMYIT
ncbi:MAG: transporter substrate-binding domain-containing protein, partial [Anaeromyxobacteraceae bacterium]